MDGGRIAFGLRVFLSILGFVAMVAGSLTVLLGVSSVVGAGDASPTLDSEIRFYAVWYVAVGGVLLWAARRPISNRRVIAFMAGLFFVAGSSRLLSWLVVGRPHWFSLVLMAIELALPFVILPWQAAAARASATRGPP